MKIAVGSDHGGFEFKEMIKDYLQTRYSTEHEVFDCGPPSFEPADDYPDYGKIVMEGVNSGKYDRGILICTKGFGMCIAGNKGKYTRAANCWNVEGVKIAREHNDINILVMGRDFIEFDDLAKDMVDAFLYTDFSTEERHRRRVQKLIDMMQ